MTDFTTQLAARWVDAEKYAAELADRYKHEIEGLTAQRDEAGRALELARTHIAELAAKLEGAEMAAEIMSDDLNQRADNDEQGAAELARYHAALEDTIRRNRAQEQTILEARRQRDEADQRANQLADKVDQLVAKLDDAHHSVATWCSRATDLEAANERLSAIGVEPPQPFRSSGSGLDAQTIAGLIAARGRDVEFVSPYLAGQWRVIRTYGSGVEAQVVLTPTFGPAPEQWVLDAPLRWLQLDDAKF